MLDKMKKALGITPKVTTEPTSEEQRRSILEKEKAQATKDKKAWVAVLDTQVNPDNIIVPPIFPNDSIARHSLAVNYSNIIEMDRQMGEIIDKLIEQDLYEDSYIFFLQ